jgi:hypothetical protein
VFAKKTDIIVLYNGDKITGEIKQLFQGRLQYSTDDMSTISVEWDKIAKISSRNRFDIELDSGVRYISSIQEAAENGKMVIESEGKTLELELLSIVRIELLDVTFWKRVKGYMDFGLNLQRADRLRQYTFKTEATYRSAKWHTKVVAESFYSEEEDSETDTRNSLNFQRSRLLKNRYFLTGLTHLQQNRELGLKFRATVGGGGGRNFKQTNSMILSGILGMAGVWERYYKTEDTTYETALFAALSHQVFRYDDPKLSSGVNLAIIPYISSFGRIRSEFEGRLSYEIIKDFSISLSAFDHFDNEPEDEKASRNDWGLTGSLTWSFD